MVTEIDNQAIIDRIIAILKNNTTEIFGPELIPTIEYGVPTNEATTAYPYSYVTFESDDDQPFEGMVGNSASSSMHRVRYIIVVMAAANTGAEVDKILYQYLKAIKETLKENVTLKNPETNLDPKCKFSWPIRTRATAPLEERDRAVGGFGITLECTIITG